MRIRQLVALLLAGFCGIALAQGPRRDIGKDVAPVQPPPAAPSGRAPTLPIDANLVRFNVVVENKSEVTISGLRKEDFKVFEDNVEQTLSYFAPTDSSLTIAIAIEYSPGVYRAEDVRGHTAALIQSLTPEDWAALVAFEITPKIVVDFTRNKPELLSALNLLDRPIIPEAAIYDTVYDMLDRMENIDGRKALFLLGTGFDTASQHTLSQTLKKAESSDTMIYALSMGQIARIQMEGRQIRFGNSIDFVTADNNMRQFAAATGGAAFFPRGAGDFPAIYGRAQHELHSQYSFGYVSKNTKTDGKLRKLRVDVAKMDLDKDGKDDGLKARHKKGYYAPKK